MKKTVLLLIVPAMVISLLIGAFGCAAPAPAPKPTPTPGWEGVELTMNCVWPPPETFRSNQMYVHFTDDITRLTDGKVTFKNNWGGALGGKGECLPLVAAGTVDLGITAGLYNIGLLPLEDIEYAFPFGIADASILGATKRQMKQEYPQFYADLANQGAIEIYNVPTETYCILSKTPIESLDYFEGKKIAAIAKFFGKWLEPVGAAPVQAATMERYTMLETGVIDASLDPSASMDAYKQYEPAPNCLSNFFHRGVWCHLYMNPDSFNALPEDVQTLFLEVGEETEIWAGKQWPEWEGELFRSWREEKGINFTELSDADMDTWVSILPDIAGEWAQDKEDKGYPGWEMAQRWQEIAADKGNVWLREWAVK